MAEAVTMVAASEDGAAAVAVVLQVASVALAADPSVEVEQEEAGNFSSYCFR